jgi:hypothetical protein
MKTVFTDISEVAHLWASQAQPTARNSGNFYFDGKIIYSYGRHFPIAEIWNKDDDIVFFTSRNYSNTTAKHKGVVRYAVNHKKRFTLPEVDLNSTWDLSAKHETNKNYYLNTIEDLIKKQKKARKYNYMGEIENKLNEFKEYIQLFKLSSKLSKPEKELLTLDVNSLFEGCKFTELREKKEKQKTAKQLSEAKKWLFHWTGGLKLKYKQNKVYLRYNQLHDTIETSKGANVPAREAKILFDRIQAGKDIKGFQIGYYTVIGINGVLKIGCHEIERDEINRIAKLMQWV